MQFWAINKTLLTTVQPFIKGDVKAPLKLLNNDGDRCTESSEDFKNAPILIYTKWPCLHKSTLRFLNKQKLEILTDLSESIHEAIVEVSE